MKQSYTSFDELLSDLANNVERVMRDDVAPQLEQRLQASAKQNVHPMSDADANVGGIADSRNIVSNVSRDGDTVTMIVKDIAMPQRSYVTGDWSNFDWGKNAAVGSTMFANWIEHGLWMDIAKWNQMGRPKDNKPKRPKREFVSPVQVEAAMVVKTALYGL